MAVRQYIGARYVPLYVGDWDSTQNYEPLTIVTDANGNSFTSLKDVPAGTALTNREYWIQTSSFSGAVEVLSNRVGAVESDVSDLNARVGNNESGISNLESEVQRIEGEISGITGQTYGTTDHTKVFLVTDSFGNAGQGLLSGFNYFMDGTCPNVWEGGANFARQAELITAYSGDVSNVEHVIVMGGSNNVNSPYNTLLEQLGAIKTASENKFPRLKTIHFAYLAPIKSVQATAKRIGLNNMVSVCKALGINFLGNFNPTLHPNFICLGADGVHPVQAGHDRAASAMFNAFMNGIAEPLITAALSIQINGITWTFETTLPCSANFTVKGSGTFTNDFTNGTYQVVATNTYAEGMGLNPVYLTSGASGVPIIFVFGTNAEGLGFYTINKTETLANRPLLGNTTSTLGKGNIHDLLY